MAITVLASGAYGPACNWQIDWDSSSQTVGITINATSASVFIVEVVSDSPPRDDVLDCVNGPAGDLVNQGREVLVGPGSVLGFTAAVKTLPTLKSGVVSLGTRWSP